MMKKLFCLCLAIAVCVLPACGKRQKNRDYNEAEVLAAAAALIPETEELNEIFYGTGIPASEAPGAASVGGYVEADPAYLEAHGFSTLKELKEKCRAVFSDGQCEIMFRSTLEVVYDGGVIEKSRRYFEADGKIFVLPTAEVLMPDAVAYDLSTLKVDHVEGDYIYLTFDADVTTADGKSQLHTLTVRLYEEARGFRLATPTYTRYSEAYNKLK